MKTTIIGAGNVGASCAMRILEGGLSDVVLLDVIEGLAKGKAEDLMDAASLIGHSKTITGTSDYKSSAASDIVVITAGFARQPGMSREELLSKNRSIVKEVAEKITSYSKNPIVIVVTNPLDVMTYAAYKASGLKPQRVFGMAGVLDSARMNLMVSRKLKLPLKGIDSLVLGTHGETMAPIISHSKIGDADLKKIVKPDDISDIVEKTKSRGAQIVSYLGKGSAFYAPSAGVFRMAKAVIEDTKEILACTCFLNGEYGLKDLYLGVPAKIGRNGVEEIIELSLPEDEKKILKTAADSVRKQIDSLNLS